MRPEATKGETEMTRIEKAAAADARRWHAEEWANHEAGEMDAARLCQWYRIKAESILVQDHGWSAERIAGLYA